MNENLLSLVTPMMTAEQKMEALKKKKQAKEATKNNQKIKGESSFETDKPALTSVVIEEKTTPITVTTLEKKKYKQIKDFEHYLLDSFRPKKFEVDRLPRTLQVRRDVAKLEARLLNLVGGSGKKHKTQDENGDVIRFSVSVSALYNHLLESFFENNKSEIERLEKAQRGEYV